MARIFSMVLLMVFWVTVLSTSDVSAQTEGNKEKEAKKGQKIRITSNELISDNDSGIAEFIGNVRAVQGDTVITSDRLKIFYKDSENQAQKLSAGPGAISKLVATGNVNIRFEGKDAVCDEAVYLVETEVLTLSGSQAKVTTPDETITGARIILYRADDKVKVEGSKDKQVEAIFYDTKALKGD